MGLPLPKGKLMGDDVLPKLLKGLQISAVPHGFRSSFRDWAQECTNAPRAVMEAALAHTIPDKTEAAYARSDLFERRRRLMEQWASYLSQTSHKVVPLVRQRHSPVVGSLLKRDLAQEPLRRGEHSL